MVKNLPANPRDVRYACSIPGSRRSPGEGNGYPLQYSCLGIPWTEETGKLQSMGSQKGGHDLVTEHTHLNQKTGLDILTYSHSLSS